MWRPLELAITLQLCMCVLPAAAAAAGSSASAVTSGSAASSAATPPDAMMPFLEHVANWTAHLSLPSNHLRMPPNSTFPAAGGTDHIFVNGNLARVLLSTYRLQASVRRRGTPF